MDFEAAVDGLYEAFAGYERPPSFMGCACCFGGGEGRAEVPVPSPGGERPLRELDGMELGTIAESVPLTGGTVELLKHYLPRLLELAARKGEVGWVDMPIVLGHLMYGDAPWTTWPASERAAIVAYLHALWLGTIDEDDVWAVDCVLSSAALVDAEIDWYLDAWLASPSANARATLDRFLSVYDDELAAGNLGNAFWGMDSAPMPDNMRRVVERLAPLKPAG